MSTVLITGARGLVGPYLVEAFEKLGNVCTNARVEGDFPGDLSDARKAREVIEGAAPNIVVHAAAKTNVDACEDDPDDADRNNRLATSNIIAALRDEAYLVYLSTDQVYPDKTGLHVEDEANPVNAYGQSKFEGEVAALAHRQSIVARTNLFGPSRVEGRKSLSDFVIDSLVARQSITLFEDVLFSPLHVVTLAQTLVEMVQAGLTGVFNVSSRDGMSKADFATSIAARCLLQTETARRGCSQEMVGRARRPLDLRMDPSRLEKALGRSMPTLEEEIAKL